MTEATTAPDSLTASAPSAPAETVMAGDPRLHQIREFLEEGEAPPVNPLVVAARAFRGRRLISLLLALLLAALFGTAAFLAVSPKYQSQGLIRVAARVPKIMYGDPSDPRLRLFDSFVSAEVTYLRSRPVLEEAMNKLVAGGAFEGAESVPDISDLGQVISVKKDKGLITVSATAKKPDFASQTVNALLESYTELHAQASNQAQQIRERKLVAREKELLEKLREIDASILNVGEEHGTTSIAKAHLNKVTQLEDINQRVDELETAIAQEEAQETSTEFDTGDEEIKRVTVLDKAMADMTYDRAKRSASLESIKLRYRLDHPRVKELESEIAVIEGAIEARRQQIVTLGKTGALTTGGENQSEESLAGLRALREKLLSRRDEVGREAKQLNSKLIDLTFLKAEHTEVRSLLDETRRTLEEVRVESRNSLPGSVEVIAYGATPKKPVEDKRKKLAVAGGGFGFMAGLGLVVLGSFARSRVRYSDDLESAVGDSSVLGVLPDADPASPDFQVSIHRLRNRLQLAGAMDLGPGRGQVIMICSPSPQSGASTISRALSESYAGSSVAAVLIDANLSNGDLSGAFSLSDAPGLKEAMINGDIGSATHSCGAENLSLLPVCHDPRVNDEHLSLAQVRRIFDGLRQKHDVVIVDAGAFDANLTNSFIASLSDQIVVASAAGESTGAVLKVAKRLEAHAHRTPMHLLNRVRSEDPGIIPADSERKPLASVPVPA